MTSERPSFEEVRSVLQSAGFDDSADIAFLADGWEQWAFRAGELVVRLPKDRTDPEIIDKLRRESLVSRTIAPHLPLPISVPHVHERAGGGVFSTHRLVPGVALRDLTRPAARGFGASLGRFLRSLHAVPVRDLAAAGVEVVDGPRERERLIDRYERVVRRVFPLLGCEARTHVERVFEAMINDPVCFDYEPALIHNDIDHRNALGDPGTGALTGIIDFGDAEIGNPALDYVPAVNGMFWGLGIEDQLPELFREGGFDPARLGALPAWTEAWWCLNDILHGLETNAPEFVGDGIRSLNEAVPRGSRC